MWKQTLGLINVVKWRHVTSCVRA